MKRRFEAFPGEGLDDLAHMFVAACLQHEPHFHGLCGLPNLVNRDEHDWFVARLALGPRLDLRCRLVAESRSVGIPPPLPSAALCGGVHLLIGGRKPHVRRSARNRIGDNHEVRCSFRATQPQQRALWREHR